MTGAEQAAEAVAAVEAAADLYAHRAWAVGLLRAGHRDPRFAEVAADGAAARLDAAWSRAFELAESLLGRAGEAAGFCRETPGVGELATAEYAAVAVVQIRIASGHRSREGRPPDVAGITRILSTAGRLADAAFETTESRATP